MLATNDAPALALTTELTLAEKEARAWDMLVKEGRDAREKHDDTNWRVGRAAVIAATTFAPEDDEQKRRFVLRKYAQDIGMVDNPHYIYDLHDTASFWPEDAQRHFKDIPWSRMRTCARHCKDLKQASVILHQNPEAPVAALRQIIAAANGEPPKKQRRSFEATWAADHFIDGELGQVVVTMFKADMLDLREVLKHPGGTLTLTYTYTAAASAEPRS